MVETKGKVDDEEEKVAKYRAQRPRTCRRAKNVNFS